MCASSPMGSQARRHVTHVGARVYMSRHPGQDAFLLMYLETRSEDD